MSTYASLVAEIRAHAVAQIEQYAGQGPAVSMRHRCRTGEYVTHQVEAGWPLGLHEHGPAFFCGQCGKPLQAIPLEIQALQRPGEEDE